MGRWRGVAAALALTAVSYPLGLAIGSRWLLPVLNTAPAYVLMVLLLRRGRRALAVGCMLAWAATLGVTGTLTFANWPVGDDMVLGGAAYRNEMFRWIQTGIGREGDPRAFLPEHLLHLGAFVALSLATASALSMTMGAVLMNHMSFYVASLSRAGMGAGDVLLWGWQPWALSRVAAFTVLGVVLAEPLLSRLRRYPYGGLRSVRRYVVWAAAGIAADWILKAALAPHWGRVLRQLMHGPAE